MKMSKLNIAILSLCLLVPSLSEGASNTASVNWDNFFIGHKWLKNTSGVIYFEKDLEKNAQAMCQDIYEQPWRLTMIDQESKEVARIKRLAPPAYKDREKYTPGQFQKDVAYSAKRLQGHCVSVNLAPVADIASRGYGSNPEFVKTYAKLFADTMRQNGIVPTWKHFPGMRDTNETVYEHNQYKVWYKNIYGEGVIDSSDLDRVTESVTTFSNTNSDFLMFSIALYPNVYYRPIIFSEAIWSMAYQSQPNSLYIPDDLSELVLNDSDIVWLFKHLDLLLFTSPNDILQAQKVLNKAYLSGQITPTEIDKKIQRQNRWRKNNKLPLLP